MRSYRKLIEKLEQGPVTAAVVTGGPLAGTAAVFEEDGQGNLNPVLKEDGQGGPIPALKENGRNGTSLLIEETAAETLRREETAEALWRDTADWLKETDCPGRFLTGEHAVFAERLLAEPELVICGGGHVSQELAVLADYLEYSYTVIDDRAEFVSPERFPAAKQRICGSFEQVLKERKFSSNAYYIIVTRGHSFDLECLELALNRPNGYVGMIGSKGKVKRVMDTLTERGYSEQMLSRVHAPIGLPIGGQTPKEIAVSIAAQLIQTKNREQPGSYLDGEMRKALSDERPKTVVTIIDKKGSAPRGTSSRMAVGKDGLLCGTVGGGKVEFEAVRQAMELVGSGRCLTREYILDTETAASLGMWCGGAVTLLFES